MKSERNGVIGGLVLLGLGLYLLFSQLFDLPELDGLASYFLAGLGVLLLIAGVVRHRPGLMIPGGIFTGLGIGVVLLTGPTQPLGPEAQTAVFLFAFAFGWVLITLFTAVFTDNTEWWPLIPGGVIALVGASMLAPERFMGVMNLMGYLWPLFLIALGVVVLVKAYRSKESQPPTPEAEDLLALEKKSG